MCRHYHFNIGHVVWVLGIGAIFILHLHGNDGTSLLVLLGKEGRSCSPGFLKSQQHWLAGKMHKPQLHALVLPKDCDGLYLPGEGPR